MPLVTKNNIEFNLHWFTLTLHFNQYWSEWLRYRDYKWHNFPFIELSLVDNYPFHGKFDSELTIALLGFVLIIEVESNKETPEDAPIMEVFKDFESVMVDEAGEIDEEAINALYESMDEL